MSVDQLPIDVSGIDEPETGLVMDVVEGDSFGSDGERDAVVTRLEAWEDRLGDAPDHTLPRWVVGEWPTAADLVDRTTDSEGTPVYVSIPGWFANLDDNEATRRTLRTAANWDGYDGARPSFWALRDEDQDDGKGAYCLSAYWDADREEWRDPPTKYGMIWVARSCVRLAEPLGDVGDLDHEPWQVLDGYPDSAGPSDRTGMDPEIERIKDRARQRAVAKAKNVPDQQFADRLEEAKAGRTEEQVNALTHALGQAIQEHRRITGESAGPGVLAAVVEAIEAHDAFEPDD